MLLAFTTQINEGTDKYNRKGKKKLKSSRYLRWSVQVAGILSPLGGSRLNVDFTERGGSKEKTYRAGCCLCELISPTGC